MEYKVSSNCKVKEKLERNDMEQRTWKLTTDQFAKLHHINKRTLHYYDNIGLFCPRYKGKNGYRYYDYMQSMELEQILMLKELHMSITEIKRYLSVPNPKEFQKIADEKLMEIQREMKRLKQAGYVLREKKRQLEECEKMKDGEIKVVSRQEEHLFMTPLKFKEYDMENILPHLQQAWEMEQYKAGCGSYISLEKVKNRDLSEYDGIYTPVRNGKKVEGVVTLPSGEYLCGYMRGSFHNPLPLYKKMLAFAEKEGMKLSGYAFERGLNEFAISKEEEYVTKIMIGIEK